MYYHERRARISENPAEHKKSNTPNSPSGRSKTVSLQPSTSLQVVEISRYQEEKDQPHQLGLYQCLHHIPAYARGPCQPTMYPIEGLQSNLSARNSHTAAGKTTSEGSIISAPSHPPPRTKGKASEYSAAYTDPPAIIHNAAQAQALRRKRP